MMDHPQGVEFHRFRQGKFVGEINYGIAHPQRLTKYMNRKWLEQALSGRLRIGTLAEYRNWEAGASHRLTDQAEGAWAFKSKERRITTRPGQILRDKSNNQIQGDLVGGVEEVHVFEGYAFCATAGAYSEIHHSLMKDRNPELDSYIEISTHGFLALFERFLRHSIAQEFGFCAGPITYCDKSSAVVSDTILWEVGTPAPANHEVNPIAAMFTKPDDFGSELEFRAGAILIGGHAPTALFTPDMEEFGDLVLGSGSL